MAGTILKNWCANPEKTSLDIIADIKTEMSLTAGVERAETLTLTSEHDILINEKGNIASTIAEPNVISLDEEVSVLCVGDDGCSSNDMSSAIHVPFFSWQSGCISCPGNEIWYKFTTNVGEAHPNGSKGWYGIQTQGSLDTVGYLYDAYGNQIDYDDDDGNNLNFKITHQLEYGETYYVKVKAFGSNTGSFSFKVDYGRDDHGNSRDTATEIVGVYYEDKSVTGYLHSYDDVDYYTFVPARNCVMEIYTEGDTNTYGQLYCASGGLLDSDADSNGNGNFKITAHLEGMKRYYIAVSHNSSTGYGDYTLRFKFVRDCLHIGDGNSVCWINDNPDSEVALATKLLSLIFLDQLSAYKYHYEITRITTRNEINQLFESGLNDILVERLCELFGLSSNLILSVGVGIMVQMVNSFVEDAGQKAFEDAFDPLIENERGFVFLMNTMSFNKMFTDYAYYDQPYFYGYPGCRGTFYV